ncbi:hypothetical protein PCANC_22659 [Puccinia coronata f. sp. avenae]|uniref:Uncharacterized protein n=1 Tax=Puccinia coronata f. sp. avenae TaxID=200324 RepID=A0A2N5SBS2_9BASI|nr:hypothetical protein PCANC_22659 [Puccinia coronata f. sp. avenae]
MEEILTTVLDGQTLADKTFKANHHAEPTPLPFSRSTPQIPNPACKESHHIPFTSRLPYLEDPKSILQAANAAQQRAATAKSRARLRTRIQLGGLPALPASPPPVSTTPTTPVGSPPPLPTTLPPHPPQC